MDMYIPLLAERAFSASGGVAALAALIASAQGPGGDFIEMKKKKKKVAEEKEKKKKKKCLPRCFALSAHRGDSADERAFVC